jgi:phosphoenolpyruvate-protein phosphotransferase
LIDILAPLDGWLVPLAEVPDPVFAGGLAGVGVAIDPVAGTLYAPCAGTVRLMRGGRHALMLATAAGDVLLHVGIDTVQLHGEGFELLVDDGTAVAAGTPLLKFNLDQVARRAPSLVTPVLLTGNNLPAIALRRASGRVRVGDVLFSVPVVASVSQAALATSATTLVRILRVPFDHGLHARPAASIAAALKGISADVEFRANGRSATTRSMIAMMSLGISRGDTVEVIVTGEAAHAAMAALESLFGPCPVGGHEPGTVVSDEPVARPVPGSRIAAVIASRGLALGPAHQLANRTTAVAPPGGDANAERAALAKAIEAVVTHLAGQVAATTGVRRDVLDAHLALLADGGLRDAADAAIGRGSSAGEAWHGALSTAAAALSRLDDRRMAERRADLLDLEQQVLQVLAGGAPGASVAIPASAIVIAAELLPSQLLALDATRVAGICTATGGATSHVAILAGSLGMPMLVAAGGSVLAIPDGEALIVDAEAGALHVAPGPAERARAERRILTREGEALEDARLATQPAALADGAVVRVDCNLGAASEAGPAAAAGADGCGLLRTEFLFLERDLAPTEEEQVAVYREVVAGLSARPLTIRTLDAGGDKPMPFLPMPTEENPALGLRGVRAGLWRPQILETQLRAILRAAAAAPCRLLLPMVTDAGDVVAVREIVDRLARESGIAAPPIGVMIETPASAMLADQLAPLVEFFSIGSNDLSQYVLAIDRLHPVLAPRLDALHPAVLRMIATAASAALAHGREVCVCGGLASDPDAVPLLIGLGVRELSVLPSMIGRIKNVVRAYDQVTCERLARQALAAGSADVVRKLVRDDRDQRSETGE